MKTKDKSKVKIKRNINVTAIFVAVMFSFYLLFVGPGGFTNISNNKFICLVVLFVLYIVVLMFEQIKSKTSLKSLVNGKDLIVYATLAYIVFTLIACFLSDYQDIVWLGSTRREGAVSLLIYAILFLLIGFFWTYNNKLFIFNAVTVSAFVAICLLQLGGSNPFGLYPENLNFYDANIYYAGTYIGTLGNADVVSGFLCLTVGIMFYYIILNKNDFWRFFLIAPLIATIYIVLKMGVSGAALGCLGVFVSAPFIAKRGSKLRKILFIILIAIVVIALIVAYFFDLGGTLGEVHNMLHGHVEDDYGTGRIQIWRSVWNIIKEHPLFGVGPDTLATFGEGFEGYNEYVGGDYLAVWDCAHNEFLNIWACQGVFALISYLIILGILAYRWYKYAPENKVIAITGVAVICYNIQAFFEMSTCTVAPFYWIILGILFGETRKIKEIQ